MKDSTKLSLHVYGLPFVAGAVWEFCPLWIAVPALVLICLQWVGALIMVSEKPEEKKE